MLIAAVSDALSTVAAVPSNESLREISTYRGCVYENLQCKEIELTFAIAS